MLENKMTIEQLIIMAKEHIKNGNLKEAKDIYLVILNTSPSNKLAKKGLSNVEYKIKNTTIPALSKEQKNNLINTYTNKLYKEAVDLGINLSKLYPENIFIYNIIGASYKGLGELQNAVLSFQEIVKIKPDFAEGYNNLGIVLVDIGKTTEAIESYQKAIKIKPDYAEAYYSLGIVQKDTGQIEEAIKSYEKAITIKPDYAEAYNNLGTAQYNIMKIEEATKSYKKAIAINPYYAEAYNNLGNSLHSINKIEEALKYYAQAIKIRPDYAEGHKNLGIVLKDAGQIEKAIKSYQKAIKIKPHNINLISELIPMLVQFNRTNDLEQIGEIKNCIMCKIYLLIDSFINKSFPKTKSLINELMNDINEDYFSLLEEKNKKFIEGYLAFISKLNPIALKQSNLLSVDTEENTIYHIGESHSLSFAHQRITLENKNYTIKPLIIFGTKAWHLHNKTKLNSYKAYFNNHINSLKVGSQLILSFGEIDCRLNEGIIEYYFKMRLDLNDIIYQTVNGYIEYSESILSKLQIKRIYMGIAAPVINDLNSIDKVRTSLRIRVIELFNKALIKITTDRQLNFIDVYKLTVNNEGFSNLKYMCDDVHLDPSSLKDLKLNFN